MCAWYSPNSRSIKRLGPKLTRRAALATGLAALFWRRRGNAAGPTDTNIDSAAYLATCDGVVIRVSAINGETTDSLSLQGLAAAVPVQDGCGLDRLMFRPPDSLLAVMPSDATVDEEGARHFRVLEWGFRDWKLRGGFDIADRLISTPNLLVPARSSTVLLAYEKTERAAMAELDIASAGLRVIRLPDQGDGPWFSRDAVWASGQIVDRTQRIVKKERRWEVSKLPLPAYEGMPWSWVGPKLGEPPASELEGVVYSVTRDRHTTLMLWAGKPRVLTDLEGAYGAKQLSPTLHGNRLVSFGTKEPAALWDIVTNKLLAKTPEEWERPQRLVCLRDDGTCILQAAGKIFLFGIDRSQEVRLSGPADNFLLGVFAG
jgi:hypothetical protein